MLKYSKEDEELLRETFEPITEHEVALEKVREMGKILDRSTHSIVSKLYTMGLYNYKKETKKTFSITKKEIVAKIADLIDAEVSFLESLEKAKKDDLEYLLQRIEAELEYAAELNQNNT